MLIDQLILVLDEKNFNNEFNEFEIELLLSLLKNISKGETHIVPDVELNKAVEADALDWKIDHILKE